MSEADEHAAGEHDEEHVIDAEVVPDEPTPGADVAPAEVGGATGLQLEPAQVQGGLLTLYGSADPKEITKSVGAIADELKNVLDKQNLTTNIPGGRKPHVDVEGWQVCGTFLGVQPVVVAIERTEPEREFEVKRHRKRWGKVDGKRAVVEETDDVWMAQGFSYRVWCEARTLAGAVVGKGVGFCSREESKWLDADEYAVIGMASTRAVSRTLRQALAFIIAMAGYASTPTEEMGDGPDGPPFGPELTDDPMIAKSREALAYLLATDGPPDDAAAARVWDEITKDCAGYMPVRVARGLLYTAAALKQKVEGGGDEPAPGDTTEQPSQAATDDDQGEGLPPVEQTSTAGDGDTPNKED